uniref:Uncharacterized protein n=1 Tax=Trichobilharzia regenti TaxID=157069 RepID=A0AA85K704_TRIRE|nr:unnamed protein product [Trichobilharzia regenti]
MCLLSSNYILFWSALETSCLSMLLKHVTLLGYCFALLPVEHMALSLCLEVSVAEVFGMTPEVFKYGGDSLLSALTEVLGSIWESEVPSGWCKSLTSLPVIITEGLA